MAVQLLKKLKNFLKTLKNFFFGEFYQRLYNSSIVPPWMKNDGTTEAMLKPVICVFTLPSPSKTDEFSEKFRRGEGGHFQSKN